jgi:hypothetical protein
MSETEQAEEAWRIAIAMPDVAAMIANDARENLGGLRCRSRRVRSPALFKLRMTPLRTHSF